jgi:Tfp pilus assembly protein PilO
MSTRTTRETAIICAAAVIAIAILSIPFDKHGANAAFLLWIVFFVVMGLVAALGYQYLITKKRVQVELTGGEQYRKLSEEYRRLSDLAVTAQEHTDLKLGDVSAQLDYLREQVSALQKILKDVE